MSNRTCLLGKIEVPSAWNGSWERNRRVLRELPEEGEWPWLIRGMFSTTPERVSYAYRAHFFAAELKGIEEDWGEWLEKFEDLLRRLEWTSATVHLETEQMGEHSYRWLADDPRAGAPAAAWRFEGGPREFSGAG